MGNGLHPDEATKETSNIKHTVKHSLHPKKSNKGPSSCKIIHHLHSCRLQGRILGVWNETNLILHEFWVTKILKFKWFLLAATCGRPKCEPVLKKRNIRPFALIAPQVCFCTVSANMSLPSTVCMESHCWISADSSHYISNAYLLLPFAAAACEIASRCFNVRHSMWSLKRSLKGPIKLKTPFLHCYFVSLSEWCHTFTACQKEYEEGKKHFLVFLYPISTFSFKGSKNLPRVNYLYCNTRTRLYFHVFY